MAQGHDDAKAPECHCSLRHIHQEVLDSLSVTEIASLPSCLLTRIFAVMCLVAGSTVKLGINYDFTPLVLV